MTELPPFLLFFAAAPLVMVLGASGRRLVMLSVPLLGGIGLLGLEPGAHYPLTVMGMPLVLVEVDRLSLLFGILFHIAAFIGFLFALRVDDRRQHAAAMIYVGSAIGAVFAGDLLTLFLFWEGLALGSVFLIWARRTPRALSAGMRYLLVQIGSGLLLLAGLLLRAHNGLGLEFTALSLDQPGSGLIFIAFGIKAAFPFLHSWLIDAYPEATPTGTVFLSAFTTKVAIYALARGFAGTEALIYIGLAMALFPIFYAVIENDLRRVLAYSLINQLGFMVVGIGIGTELAINGAVAHAFSDVLFKGLLMMAMGAVLQLTGESRASELGGLYKKMPLTTGLCLVGAASISAFPLFTGFVSKSLIMVAVLQQGYHGVWLGLLFAAAGVFHHAGIKVPFFAFFSHDSCHLERAREPPLNMLLAMGIAATLCIAVGVFPALLYDLLPYPVAYQPYTAGHVLAQLQLLCFAALAFTWLKLAGLYPPELKAINLDADWVYRALLPRWGHALIRRYRPIQVTVRRAARRRVRQLLDTLYRHHGPHGLLARAWPTGSMVMWVATLLCALLVLYHL